MADESSDLGFVPDAQTENHDDLGFVPNPPPTPNMKPISKVFDANLAAAKLQTKDGVPKEPNVHPAQGFLEDWMAGWQMSTTALGITRKNLPDTVLPEDAGRFAKIISQAGTLAGDLPAMLAGGIGGAAAGGVVAGPVGVTIGANAGAFALPAAIRQVLIDHYKKGDIQNFSDFYDRASSTLLETLKAGTVGAATGAAGMAAGALMPAVASPLLKMGATTAAEGAVMTTVGKALDGKIPNASDFADTALLLGVLHGVSATSVPIAGAVSSKITSHIQNKLMDTYSATGIHPHEMNELATNDPVLRQQLLSDDHGIPDSLKKAVSEGASGDPHSVSVKPNTELNESAASLSAATKDEGAGTLKVEPLDDKDNPEIPNNPTKGDEAPERTEAETKILDRIGSAEEKQTGSALDWNKFYYQFVDKNDPIKVATKALSGEKVLGAKDDPYALVRSISANGRRAEAAIEAGPADFKTLEPTGTPGLKEILSPFKNDLDGFKAYAIASRALELEGQGRQTGMDVDAAREVVSAGKAKYKEGFSKFVDFQNDILKYGKDAGLYSDETYSKMLEANKSYVSFKRVMGADEESGSSGNGRGLSVFNPVKELKGSERQIIDPLESTIKNTQAIISLAEKNRAMMKLTDMIDTAGNPELGVKVKTPMQAIEVKGEEIENFLKENNLDLEDMTIFRPDRKDLEDNQIVSYKDGKRQIYEVPQLLADSIKSLDDKDVGNLTKMLAIPAKGLRSGMIASPDFMMRHAIRQEFMSAIFSKDKYIPIMTTLQGLGGILGKTDDYYDWLRARGANDSIASLDKSVIKADLFGLNEKTGFLDKGWNTIKAPIEGLKMVTQYLDEARTFGKFQNSRAAGKDVFQSAFDARDSAIDASRVGASMRAWNMITPFENMRIQGLDLIGRNFQDNPVGTTAKLMTGITLPSVYLWYANHDDPRWRDIPNYVKDTSFVFMTKDHIFRVPKPFEPGVVFGSLPERILEAYFTDNPRAFKDFQKTMVDSAMPQYIPAFASPVIEQYSNKSLMTGSPLISDRMTNVSPAYQSNPYTSTMAKAMSGVLRQIPSSLTQSPGSLGSPIVMDNYVHSWGGNLGQYALQTADAILEKSGVAKAAGIQYNENPPEKTLADIPFIKAFVVRYPSSSPQAIGDFYDRFEQTQTRLNTIQMLAKQGDFKDMQKEYVAGQLQHELVNLGGYKTAMSQQSQLIQKIYQDTNTDPHQKRQQIDQFYTLIMNEAHMANKILDNLDASMKEHEK